MKREKKDEQGKNSILYKQFQEQQNEEDDFEEEEESVKQPGRKSYAIYGMFGVIVLMLGVILYNTMIKKDSVQMVFRDAESSNRVIKTETGLLSVSSNKIKSKDKAEDIENIDSLANDEKKPDLEEEKRTADSSSSDLYALAVEAGFSGSREEFYNLMKSWNTTEEKLQKDLDKLKDLVTEAENIKDGKNGRDGTAGRQGAAGKDGTIGKDGTDGKTTYTAYADNASGAGFSLTPTDKSKCIGTSLSAEKTQPQEPSAYTWRVYIPNAGKDGADGKTTYIAYAENTSGTGFSLTPTEKTKCIGTCLTAEKTQPRTPSDYTWEVYRSHVMTSVTDENNVTTLYIQ